MGWDYSSVLLYGLRLPNNEIDEDNYRDVLASFWNAEIGTDLFRSYFDASLIRVKTCHYFDDISNFIVLKGFQFYGDRNGAAYDLPSVPENASAILLEACGVLGIDYTACEGPSWFLITQVC